MKRIALWLLLIFAVHNLYHLAPAFSQETTDTLEIKKVINDYLDSMAYQDAGLAKKYISPVFSATIGGQAVNYESFDSFRSSQIERFHKNIIGYSLSQLHIFNLEVGDNKAGAEVALTWKALNQNTLEEAGGKRALKFILAKENNAWKITSLSNLPVLEEDNSSSFEQYPDFPEIKKTVDGYLQALARKDIGSMMSFISLHYKDTSDGKNIDYDAVKALFEFILNTRLNKFNNCSISDIRYASFKHKDMDARVRVSYIWEGDNTETGKRLGYGRSRDFELAKENGTWMITRVSIERYIAVEDAL